MILILPTNFPYLLCVRAMKKRHFWYSVLVLMYLNRQKKKKLGEKMFIYRTKMKYFTYMYVSITHTCNVYLYREYGTVNSKTFSPWVLILIPLPTSIKDQMVTELESIS